MFKDPDHPDTFRYYNTANWVGFKKSTANISLLNLLKGYICKYWNKNKIRIFYYLFRAEVAKLCVAIIFLMDHLTF